MIEHSGQNWHLESPIIVDVQVIEPTKKRERKRQKKAKGKKKQPFGFARAQKGKRK